MSLDLIADSVRDRRTIDLANLRIRLRKLRQSLREARGLRRQAAAEVPEVRQDGAAAAFDAGGRVQGQRLLQDRQPRLIGRLGRRSPRAPPRRSDPRPPTVTATRTDPAATRTTPRRSGAGERRRHHDDDRDRSGQLARARRYPARHPRQRHASTARSSARSARACCCSSASREGDDAATADRLADKIAEMRIFADDDGRFDRSLLDTGGAALVVSQFTLLADVRKGRRPSFTAAARAAKSPRRSSTRSARRCGRAASASRPGRSARRCWSSCERRARDDRARQRRPRPAAARVAAYARRPDEAVAAAARLHHGVRRLLAPSCSLLSSVQPANGRIARTCACTRANMSRVRRRSASRARPTRRDDLIERRQQQAKCTGTRGGSQLLDVHRAGATGR